MPWETGRRFTASRWLDRGLGDEGGFHESAELPALQAQHLIFDTDSDTDSDGLVLAIKPAEYLPPYRLKTYRLNPYRRSPLQLRFCLWYEERRRKFIQPLY